MMSQSNVIYSNANEEILSFMAEKFLEMKETFQEQSAILRDRINAVEEALAERKVLIEQLVLNHSNPEESPITTKFPIDSEEDLVKINNAIDDTNIDVYIKAMQMVMRPKGVHSYLRNIMSDSIIMNYNVDGVHGKKSLKMYSNFYEALLKSIPVTNLSGSAESQLRDAIKIQKKRNFKLIYDERKKNTKSDQVESIENGSNSNSQSFL